MTMTMTTMAVSAVTIDPCRVMTSQRDDDGGGDLKRIKSAMLLCKCSPQLASSKVRRQT